MMFMLFIKGVAAMVNQSIENEITDYLKEKILSGEFAVHDMVSERTICRQFNVSRTIVRQAFKTLKNSHWLYSRSAAGTSVAPVDYEEVVDNYKARIVIEPEVLLMAYPNISAVDIEEMKNSLQAIQTATIRDYYRLETGLHLLITHRSNNRFIIMAMEPMVETMNRLASLSIQGNDRVGASYTEWNEIITQLEKRDPQQAAFLLRRHMFNSFENFKKNWGQSPAGVMTP